MKKCYYHVIRFSVAALMLIATYSTRAQFVTVPDANFVTWLSTHGYSGCLNGNQLDTTCAAVLNTHGLYITGVGIYNFTGLQYFKNLDTLNCSHDSLQLIPSFPSTLAYLDCGYNFLNTIPAFPSALNYLSCEQNALSTLPVLPGTLTQINCSFNQLGNLPTLPSALTLLYCNYNSLSSMPGLPGHLATLDCSNNPINTLPTLPTSLQQLVCEADGLSNLPTLSTTGLTDLNCVGDSLDSIPLLPATLQTFLCSSNQIVNLPALPAGLTILSCDGNLIDSLPALPSGLVSLNCGNNNITELPVLPYKLTTLWCNQNRLTELPELPDSLYQLNCYFNQHLTCLPELKRIVNLEFFNCGITCLPNYGHVTNSNPALNTLPLCALFNPTGCNVYSDISGQVFYDANHNCYFDAADAPQANVKVQLFANGSLLQQVYTSNSGEYSFQAPYGNYVVRVDTTMFPFKNTCQHNGALGDTLTVTDSLSFGNNFAFNCRTTGFDLGVNSILNNDVTPVPSNIITINTVAGDITALYGAHCAAGTSGGIELTFSGPVTYIGPATGALTPSNTSSSNINWNISDFGAVNNYTAFNTMFRVNANATPGAQICFTATISPSTGDFYPANNTLTYCFTVASAQAANVKEVYPAGQIDTSSQWLTYTIRFANTGADTVQNMQITDTLDPSLNASTFQLLSASAKNLTQLSGNVVKFSFININLPTVAVNDSSSRGYVQYRVKTNNGLPGGTVISNAASIAYNLVTPVNTNTVSDTIIQAPNAVQSIQADGFAVRVFPNPASSQLYVQISQPGSYTLKLFDIEGKLLYTETTANTINTLNISSLAPGIYIAEINKGEIMQRLRWVKM